MKLLINCALALAVIGVLLHIAKGKRDFTLDVTNFTIRVSRPEYVTKCKYSLVEKRFITAEYVWAKNITAFRVGVQFDMLNRVNRPISLLKLDADGCKVIQSLYQNKLFQAVLKEIFRSGGLPKKCPILTTQPFFVNNYTVQADHFPPFMPNTMFKTNVSFFVQRMHIAEMIIEGEVYRY